jgi:hypothetical protein
MIGSRPGYSIYYRGQDVYRSRHRIQIPPAMIRHYNPGHSRVDRSRRIIRIEDPLEQ